MNPAQANAKITIKNEASGTEIEGVAAFIQGRKRNAFPAWSQLVCVDTRENTGAQGATIMNQIQKLRGESLRLLLSLLFLNGYRNEVMLDPRDLADETGMCLQNVYRSLKDLSDAGFLEKKERTGTGRRGSAWFLSEKIVWRGGGREHIRLVKNQEQEEEERGKSYQAQD